MSQFRPSTSCVPKIIGPAEDFIYINMSDGLLNRPDSEDKLVSAIADH